MTKLQRSTTNLLRKLPFARLVRLLLFMLFEKFLYSFFICKVREIAMKISRRDDLRFQYLAIAAIQEVILYK